jgi:hypothetical protein
MQRPERSAAREFTIGLGCIAPCLVAEHFHNGVDARIDSFNAAKVRFNDFRA